MIRVAFNEVIMIESFVSSGMLDSTCMRCPDLYGLMDSFKVIGLRWLVVSSGL